MSKPVLYLLVGYPGAGKTTTAKLIADRTGAVHLWADEERHKMFDQPMHSEAESVQLYEYLNHRAAELLSNGDSVVFDTNFNFLSDRDKLREIGSRRGADTIVVWLTTPVEIARERAVCDNEMRNGYQMTMSNEQFNAIVSKLEPPTKNEKVIKIDGTKFDAETAARLLKI
jgi:predicted kinase